MEQILTLDENIFWFINSHHSAFFDWIMWAFSAKWSWALVIVASVIYLVRKENENQNENLSQKAWKAALWLIVGIALCFLLADQISTNAIKDGVQRLRPCHALDGVHMFREGRGGKYGFVSSHAANVFALATFFSLCYKTTTRTKTASPCGRARACVPTKTRRKFGFLDFRLMIFLWAIAVCYSRSYLGKHYPGDLLCGALLGLGVGALVYFAISKIRLRTSSKSEA